MSVDGGGLGTSDDSRGRSVPFDSRDDAFISVDSRGVGDDAGVSFSSSDKVLADDGADVSTAGGNNVSIRSAEVASINAARHIPVYTRKL